LSTAQLLTRQYGRKFAALHRKKTSVKAEIDLGFRLKAPHDKPHKLGAVHSNLNLESFTLKRSHHIRKELREIAARRAKKIQVVRTSIDQAS